MSSTATARQQSVNWTVVTRHLVPGATVLEKTKRKLAGLGRLLVHFPPSSRTWSR
jgi:hypothetical protein